MLAALVQCYNVGTALSHNVAEDPETDSEAASFGKVLQWSDGDFDEGGASLHQSLHAGTSLAQGHVHCAAQADLVREE